MNENRLLTLRAWVETYMKWYNNKNEHNVSIPQNIIDEIIDDIIIAEDKILTFHEILKLYVEFIYGGKTYNGFLFEFNGEIDDENKCPSLTWFLENGGNYSILNVYSDECGCFYVDDGVDFCDREDDGCHCHYDDDDDSHCSDEEGDELCGDYEGDESPSHGL